MAVKLKTSLVTKKKRGKEAVEDAVSAGYDLTLPMEYEEPVNDINAYSFLIHGEKKIGKTTLSMQGGNVFIMQCDPSQRAYKRKERVIQDWRHFKGLLKKLEALASKGELPYDRVVIDRADIWFRMCEAYVCEKLAISHPSEESWGKGWAELRKEFTLVVDRVLNLPCGKWFLVHSTWKDTDTRDGDTITKLLPSLTGTAEEVLNGKVDAWFAYDYVGNRRVLVVTGDERTGAGHRLDQEGYEHFRTTGGEPVREIDMGDSPKEAYERLLKAFHNNQKRSRVGKSPEEVEKTRKKVKLKKRSRDEVAK